jgi:hypothetical protein
MSLLCEQGSFIQFSRAKGEERRNQQQHCPPGASELSQGATRGSLTRMGSPRAYVRVRACVHVVSLPLLEMGAAVLHGGMNAMG